MREPHFDNLRAYVDDAARQPDFAVIRQRAVRVRRRRRATASSAAAVVAALFATSLGYATAGGPQAPDPTPSVSAVPDVGWPRVTSVVATGSTDLYAVFEPCRDCAAQLYASDDAGASWQRRAAPPRSADDVGGMLVSLGGNALAWRESRRVLLLEEVEVGRLPSTTQSPTVPPSPPAPDRLWITVDGGRTWRRPVVDPKPVTAVPPGTRPVDCQLVGRPSPCKIYAVDPVSGRFAPLVRQPGITVEARWTDRVVVPLGAQLWVPGLDPASGRPAVASSADGGRTWNTTVFGGGEQERNPALSTVTAGTGDTAYALVYRDDHSRDPYRTTDGGATWRPVRGGALTDIPARGLVTTDGAHVVRSSQGFQVSRDGGRYQPATLPGYPADLLQPTAGEVPVPQAAKRYLVWSESYLYLSDDGWTWRQVDMP
ncbi:sialidase family protein [Plantactinospora soyae]|uniref:Uncharacterized protein n=1 Tax=Plantactinospora soyae TaxID=1544732 RepID=A0A927R7H0_9ACTN|nr:hypothetical protein [Plantactinospora soyae]MBE1489419.1 hypothetical protein [Plantactinospora soyae]